MKKITILVLTPLLGLLCSCDAFVKTIHVTGQVIDATTCKPIKNAHLVIAKFSATGSGYSVEKGNEVYTDATGIYQLEIDNASGSDFRIVAQADGYFESERDDYRIPIDKNVYKYTIHMTPKGYVNFVANKIDTIASRIEVGYQGTYGSFALNLQKGLHLRDSTILEIKGNQNTKLSFYVSKTFVGGIQSTALQYYKIYSVAHDTTTYLVNY